MRKLNNTNSIEYLHGFLNTKFSDEFFSLELLDKRVPAVIELCRRHLSLIVKRRARERRELIYENSFVNDDFLALPILLKIFSSPM